MGKPEAESFIRERKCDTRSTDCQVQTSHAMWDNNIGPDHKGLKRKEIEDALDLSLGYKPKTILRHLKEIGVVEEIIPPDPQTLVIAEWMNDGEGKIVLGGVSEAAEEGLEALAEDLELSPLSSEDEAATADGSGITLRSVVASELGLIPEGVEDYLRTTDESVDVLNDAVEAIESADGVEKGEGYGKITFVNKAYRYRLTGMAVDLYER